jgi:hypothetical protein
MLTVCAFLWFDERGKRNDVYRYGGEHVARLKAMLARHLSLPHELVCVTNIPDRVDGVCRTVPLDMTTFVPGTRYAKLMLFRRDIGDIIGRRILYLDLDCVIVGSLDPVVDRPEPLVLWRNPNARIPGRSRYNSSIMLMDAGCRPDLYEGFNPQRHPTEIRRYTSGTDQAWVSLRCSESNPYWDDSHGVRVASRKGARNGVGEDLPEGARIVFFPGQHEPGMKSCQEEYPWIPQHLPQ